MSDVNLKLFTARCTPDLDDAAIVSVLQSNGFLNLKQSSAHDFRFLSKISVFYLVENFGNLHCLKGCGKWSGIHIQDMPEVHRKAIYLYIYIFRCPSYYYPTGSLSAMPTAYLQYSN
jgi:hypothetical protein